jgi:hypothetical protein
MWNDKEMQIVHLFLGNPGAWKSPSGRTVGRRGTDQGIPSLWSQLSGFQAYQEMVNNELKKRSDMILLLRLRMIFF